MKNEAEARTCDPSGLPCGATSTLKSAAVDGHSTKTLTMSKASFINGNSFLVPSCCDVYYILILRGWRGVAGVRGTGGYILFPFKVNGFLINASQGID